MSPTSPRLERCLEAVDIVVLAGGLGTRLRPVLGDTPKLLAPVGGRPFLSYLLRWFSRFGARRVVLALGHGAADVLDYLRDVPDTALEITAVVEPYPLGTAGALRFARSWLRSDPVLVMNGDSFVAANLCRFLAFYRMVAADGAVLCALAENAGRYGRISIDENMCIRRFVEKDVAFRGSAMVNTGVYLFSGRLLDAIDAMPGPSLETDVFERLPAGSLAAFTGSFDFIDIGTPESFAAAATMLAPWFGRVAAAQMERAG